MVLDVAEYKTVGSGLVLRSRLEALINEYDEPVSIKKMLLIKSYQQFAILISSRHKRCEFKHKIRCVLQNIR